MDELKILFYIAVLVVWLVIKNYQKIQKSRPVINKSLPRPFAAKNSEKEKSIREALTEKIPKRIAYAKSEIRKEYDKYIEKREADKSEAASLKRKPVSKRQEENLTYSMEEKRNEYYIESPGLMEQQNFQENLRSEIFGIGNFFDIRTAVLYSEILKRPVY